MEICKTDIYFKYEYGKLHEKIDKGVCELFRFENEKGAIQNLFIKRPIPVEINGLQYYDIISPYGFGGPIIVKKQNDSVTSELVRDYSIAFADFCRENRIVSEFVKFNPVMNNAKDFWDIYHPEFSKNTVGIDLRYDDPVRAEFTKRKREYIRQALRRGISYRIIEKPDDLSSFKKIYYETMERNDARDYYFFGDEYFEQCSEVLRDNILLIEAVYQENTIAAEMYLLFEKTMHFHLGGTLNEYYNLSPTSVMRYAATIWGKEKGYELIHQGGGIGATAEDKLYLSKKNFGMNTEFEYYVSKKIWDDDMYAKLCLTKNIIATGKGYFPEYR